MDVVVLALGNPGPEYARTRHNIAWRVADALAERWRADTWQSDGPALAAAAEDGAGRVCLVKPQTYMNRSGGAFVAWLEGHPRVQLELLAPNEPPPPDKPPESQARPGLWRRVWQALFWGGSGLGRGPRYPVPEMWRLAPGEIATASLLVIADDVALPLGALRLRRDGSSGGHNGLADVERALGTSEYARLRVGVGSPLRGVAMTDWVLGTFAPEEEEARLPAVVRTAADAADLWRREGMNAAQTRYNGLRID